jgi:undecaprenyl diphosphate synthase
MSFKEQIDISRIPKHVAIIMDGNGRWAAQRGNDRIFGHEHGVDAVRDSIKAAAEIGVKFLTMYAFSTENWNRPKIEVNALMTLMVKVIKSESDDLFKNNVRLKVIGDHNSLPTKVKKEVEKIEVKLSGNTGLTVIMALSYSSKWEIINAVKSIASDVKKGKIEPDNISQELFDNYLSTANIPDPELMIRTSGERRLSNFLLWQLAYAELYFTPKLWPDFSKEDFWEAICSFQQRERRFGKTSDQIKNTNSK